MGYKLVTAAYRIQIGSYATKAVLIAIADAGCNTCGLAFPGVPSLVSKTELGTSTVRKGLEALTRQGLIRPVRYLNGGRGVATEYLLLEHLMELSTAPCGECRKKMKNPPPTGGYDKAVTSKPTTRRRVSGKTLQMTRENPPPGGDQQSVTDTTVSTAESSPPAHREASSDPPDPTPWAENAAQARRLADLFGPIHPPDRPATVNGDPSIAETADHQEEAQD